MTRTSKVLAVESGLLAVLSRQRPAPNSGSRGGPSVGVTSNTGSTGSGSQGTSVSAPNGSGSTGISGPGYPLIPGIGPALQGDATALREPIPVLLPGPEPALAVIPT